MSDSFEPTVTLPINNVIFPYGDRLPENGILGRGCGLKSQDNLVTLTLNWKGELLLANRHNQVFWSVKGKDIAFLIMQTDGNCVGYTSRNEAVWATASNGGCHPYTLVCQNDGNLVVNGSQRFWSSGTADRMAPWQTLTGFVDESVIKQLDAASGFSQGGFQQSAFQPVPSNDPGFKSLDAKADFEQTEVKPSDKLEDSTNAPETESVPAY